ncbi:MAG: YicC family protein [Fimbriimonadaceae bacterium]|nr:YicC family protein [Alphaproteobacteria bacterium]
MAPNSMTGFARREGSCGAVQWYWEIRSVNGKGLDIRMRLGSGNEALEPFVREQLRSVFSRGSIQVSLNVSRVSDEPHVRINEEAVGDLLAKSKILCAQYDLDPPTMNALLNVRGVVDIVEPQESEEEIESRLVAMKDNFKEAVAELETARHSEGGRIVAVLEDQLSRIATLGRDASNAPSRSPENIRKKLAEQVERLLQGPGEFDESRLHQEAVLLAAKVDIQEELDRLEAHVGAARELLGDNQPVGRKLDFLAQEFNREANTLCSKSNHVDLTSIGLELKVVVDQLREQVQNIE